MKNLSPKTVILWVGIIVTIASIAATSRLESQNNITDAGNFISLSLAQHSKLSAEQLFGADQLYTITSQRDFQGLRVYYTCDQILLVGTDAQGNDLTDIILSFGMEGVGERELIE